MLQDIKDEILSGDPRYAIRDSSGNVLNDNVDISLKTPITQEGTPVNRALFRNLQGDLYSSNGYNTLIADRIETEIDLSKMDFYNSLPANAQIQRVAYGNGVWIAVGNSGTILKSTDNYSWVTKTSGTTESFKSIVFDGINFVALTYRYGQVYVSNDNGETWELKATLGTKSDYGYDLDYKDGVYVITIAERAIYTSTDLVNWTSRLTSKDIRSVSHNEDGFLALEYYGKTYFSADGVSWAERTEVGDTSLSGGVVKWVKDRFIVGGYSGNLHYSKDNGLSWNSTANASLGKRIINIYHDGIKYIASSEIGFNYSYDGNVNTWETVALYPVSTYPNITCSYIYGDKIYCFVASSSTVQQLYILQSTKVYKAYFKLSIPLSSYVTGKILRVKAVTNGGKSSFTGFNYLNVNNLGEKPINSIFKSNEYLDLMYTGSGWNVIGPRFSYGRLSITGKGTQYIPFGFNAKAVFAYCHIAGVASNDGHSMGFIPLQYNTETLLEVYANGPIEIYGILQAYDTLTIRADSLSANCVVDYFAIAW